MQRATIREIQHNLAAVLKKVEGGEEFQVLRRKKPIARIVPLHADDNEPPADWSAHAAEISRIFHGRVFGGKPMQEIVAEGRGER